MVGSAACHHNHKTMVLASSHVSFPLQLNGQIARTPVVIEVHMNCFNMNHFLFA
jgi:hypothetical protein